MSGVGGPGPDGQQVPPPSSTGRRIGPYEQSLIDSRERVEAEVRARATRQRRTRALAAVVVALLVAGAGYAAWRIVGQREVATSVPESAAQPTSCADPTAVRIAVAPAAAPVVAAAAEALSKHPDGPCAAFDIEPTEAYAVAGSLVGSMTNWPPASPPPAWVVSNS